MEDQSSSQYSVIISLVSSVIINRNDRYGPAIRAFYKAFLFGYTVTVAPKLLKYWVAFLFVLFKKGSSKHPLGNTIWNTGRALIRALRPRAFAMACAFTLGGWRLSDELSKYVFFIVPHSLILQAFLRSIGDQMANPSGGERTETETTDRDKLIASRVRTFVCSSIFSFLGLCIVHSNPSAAPKLAPYFMSPTSKGKSNRPRSYKTIQSPTLDLTLLLAVRAADSLVRLMYFNIPTLYRLPSHLTDMCDVVVFSLSCAKIMHSWFFYPDSLPPAYSQWITKLADMDVRLLEALRYMRDGTLKYGEGRHREILMGLSKDLGFPREIADIKTRRSVDCRVIHGGVADSCHGNTIVRWGRSFYQSLMIYLPVHFIPLLLFRMKELKTSPFSLMFHTLMSVVRSASFLSTFVASIWFSVCLTRTLLGPKLFPNLRDNLPLDNRVGLIGSLICGLSILIENKRRRSEMALYVLPRALYILLDQLYLGRGLSNGKNDAQIFVDRLSRTMRWEKLVFGLSMGTVVTSLRYKPELVRGLVKGVLVYTRKSLLYRRYRTPIPFFAWHNISL
ncbi:hypothetical protein PROFUN_11981 [Planoprotostelium fungivorum]|uniref:Transmembrane protein 135 N-terminal domain-containing protein n=1 Tax=Planoprotostelium fungivorum TaxID=1890364 RepID=A0A2P6N8V5_9EUKA|nr:hypothetical protein PROFUN_11981 [Planoprotostelium fungivorum]